MTEKSKKNAVEKFEGQIIKIQKSKNKDDEYYQINLYNSMVVGIQNYYQIATNVNLDLQEITFLISHSMNYRLRKRIKRKSEI